MRRFVFSLFLLIWPTAGHAEWQPDATDKQQVAVRQTIDDFIENEPRVQEYFEQAAGYAVFPRVWRAAFMWGGAYGKGLVFGGGELVGSCSQVLGSVGAQLGLQSYQQVVLFNSQAGLAEFQEGRLEFQGRASAAVATVGKSAEPGHLPEVAIFSLTRGGLMLEASANIVKFGYKPIEPTAAEDDEPGMKH